MFLHPQTYPSRPWKHIMGCKCRDKESLQRVPQAVPNNLRNFYVWNLPSVEATVSGTFLVKACSPESHSYDIWNVRGAALLWVCVCYDLDSTWTAHMGVFLITGEENCLGIKGHLETEVQTGKVLWAWIYRLKMEREVIQHSKLALNPQLIHPHMFHVVRTEIWLNWKL